MLVAAIFVRCCYRYVKFTVMKRWDFKLENEVCPTCKGDGSILESADMHRSEGWIPCPMKYFQGHGYPTCGEDGKLHFTEYDIKNKKRLMKEYR